MEKPAVPGLRCALPIAANSAANSTMPLPRNSRFVASHLQEEENTGLLLGALLPSPNRIRDYFAKHLWSCQGTGCSTKLLSCSGCSYPATLSSGTAPVYPNWLACGLCWDFLQGLLDASSQHPVSWMSWSNISPSGTRLVVDGLCTHHGLRALHPVATGLPGLVLQLPVFWTPSDISSCV